MINPIKKAMKEKGLDRLDLSLLAGVDTSYIGHLESGRVGKISPKVLSALKQLGYDPERMQEQFIAYRAELIQQVLEKVRA